MPSHIDPLVALGKRLREVAKELGADLGQFLLVPDLDGDAHQVQALFVLPDLEEDEDVDIEAQAAAFMADIEAHEATMREDDLDG